MEPILTALGNFFAKHSMLYTIALMFTLTGGINIGYVHQNFVQAADFAKYVYDDTRDKLLKRKYEIEDTIFELKRRIEKGIQTQGDVTRLKEKTRELSQIQDQIRDHESNRPQ